jgi:hypothetical protein
LGGGWRFYWILAIIWTCFNGSLVVMLDAIPNNYNQTTTTTTKQLQPPLLQLIQ